MSFDHRQDLPVAGAVLAHAAEVGAPIEFVVHFGLRLDPLRPFGARFDDDVMHA